jgi:hypothetical protein
MMKVTRQRILMDVRVMVKCDARRLEIELRSPLDDGLRAKYIGLPH